MILPTRSRRRAYTLLEIVIATAISVLLLAAVFAAMEMETRHMQAGRDVSEQSILARALLDRIGSDIMHSLTPVNPVFFPSLSSSPTGSGTGSSATSPSSSSSPTTNSTYQFDFGLQGESSKLTLFSCGLPPAPDPQQTEFAGDLRFITYWLAGSNQEPLGLARMEVARVTGDEAGQVPASGSAEEAACLIAEEVKTLEFRYLDKTGWNATWDGTLTGPDFVTLIGPPRAIEIRLSMFETNQDRGSSTKPKLHVYRHVVAVPTAQR
jgi:hypothetical protein